MLGLMGPASCSAISGKRLEDGDSFLGLRADRVIGIGFGGSDDAAALDHEACRHRQLPRRVPIALGKVVFEHVEVNVLQVVR